jgi:hypothetical protein
MSRPSTNSNRRHAFCALSALLLGLNASLTAEPDELHRLQTLVDGLRVRLAIDSTVSPAIVTSNPLLVSVEPTESKGGSPAAFRMSFDATFLAGLDEEALTAIVAHELGHVWIFTHHPYLQTERLANSVAMRVVSRDSLERVYAKVWQRAGVKGDLAHFLGESQ